MEKQVARGAQTVEKVDILKKYAIKRQKNAKIPLKSFETLVSKKRKIEVKMNKWLTKR